MPFLYIRPQGSLSFIKSQLLLSLSTLSIAMTHSRDELIKSNNRRISTEARLTYESEKGMIEIDGHLKQALFRYEVRKPFQNPNFRISLRTSESSLKLLLLVQELPRLPGHHRFGKPTWVTPLLTKVRFTARSYLHQWGLTCLLVFAKHYKEMFIHWEAVSALIEIWHPQTHTFLFRQFEASILIEETELFLGLKHRKAKNTEVAHCMELLNTEDFIQKLTGNQADTKNIVSSKRIQLSRLAIWTMKAKDNNTDDEKIAQGLTLCLAGLIFFPNCDDLLDQEHLGVIQSAWQGRSIAQAVLAYLYSGLTSASLRKPFYGCVILLDIWLSFHLKIDYGAPDIQTAKSYERSPIYKIGKVLHYTDSMVIKTLKLHSQTD